MPVRVHEISKKWGIKSTDLLDRLDELGIEAASHMSAIEDADVAILAKDIVRRPIKPGAGAKRRAARKAAEKKAAEEKAALEKAEKEAAEKKAAEEKAAAEKAAAEKEAAEAAAQAAKAEEEARTEAAEEAEEVLPETPAEPEKPAGEAPAADAAASDTAEKPAEEKAAPEEAKAAKPRHGRPSRKKEKPEEKKVAAVDENLLKEQMAQAAQIAAKESKEESRILRRIILPPRKRSRKKRKVPVGFDRPARRIIAPSRPDKVELQSPVTVRDFSQASGIKTGQLMKKLMDLGAMSNINAVLSDEMVELLGAELNVEVSLKRGWTPDDELAKLEKTPEEGANLARRAPVVTLLGHVDHGKTSLLDAVRHSDVTAGEHGGITQHTGAYQVTTDAGNVVTFVDTPGHEAFTEMRARGANVTDIVILVVAADDGVMPQTIEAINHAKAADVPIVVAVNKVDKPDAQVERVKRQLTNYGLVPEEWGGDVIVVPVSATTGEGVDSLLEMISIQAEMLELQADPERPAIGTVIEAKRTEGRGVVATVLVREGTLKIGDVMVAGVAYGKLRGMSDERGNALTQAPPSTPVEVSGLGEVPAAGDRFYALDDLQKAREIAETRLADRRSEARVGRKHVSLENLMESFEASGVKELKVVIKADVQGTLEVLTRSLGELSVPEVQVRVIHSGVGGINESDILLADASDAIILGFNVVAEQAARSVAESKNVEIRIYNVIYNLIDEMKAALENRLEPEIREVIRGHAEVRDTFKISRIGTIAGCMVTDGVIPRRANMRVARQGVVVHEGSMESLKHFKDDVREVREGFECGIKMAGYDDLKVGDVFEAFELEKIPRKLS